MSSLTVFNWNLFLCFRCYECAFYGICATVDGREDLETCYTEKDNSTNKCITWLSEATEGTRGLLLLSKKSMSKLDRGSHFSQDVLTATGYLKANVSCIFLN